MRFGQVASPSGPRLRAGRRQVEVSMLVASGDAHNGNAGQRGGAYAPVVSAGFSAVVVRFLHAKLDRDE